jgi:hypothetical protein
VVEDRRDPPIVEGEREAVRKAARRIGALIFATTLVAALEPNAVFVPAQAIFTIVVGWCPACYRLIERVHANRPSTAPFLGGLAILLAGTHQFLRWFYARRSSPDGTGTARAWPWRWTVCGFGALACSVMAAGCAILVVHQLYWLSRSNDLVFPQGRGTRSKMRVAWLLNRNAEASGPRTGRLKAEFDRVELEENDVLFVGGDDEPVEAVIVIPRRPMRRAEASILLLRHGTNRVDTPPERLADILAQYGIRGGFEREARIGGYK